MTDRRNFLTLIDAGEGDEPLCNQSSNVHFSEVLDARLQRRDILKGSLGMALTGMFGVNLAACGSSSNNSSTPTPAPRTSLVGFKAIPVSSADTVVVPEGYSVDVIGAWGEPISGNFPAYTLSNSGEDQGHQIGSHHDGMHFFPIEGNDPYEGSSTDGLLVLNHEYVEPRFMHQSAVGQSLSRSAVPVKADGTRVTDEVLKEINGHGVSVYRITRNASGKWNIVADPRNRRITGATPMEINGPVRGSDFVKTLYSPNGTRTRGTLNNCAHGVTPWNTYMTAEENWAGYFVNRGERPREHSRYGVGTSNARYGWDLADNGADEFLRFDVTTKAADATLDYRNEPNAFGWMVEIDPFDPTSTPVKRTALGRFAHEGVVFHAPVEGKPVVCYSGDDARNEYIYKFVSAQNYKKATAGGHLLDTGTLYVAKFNADGSGEWLPLVYGVGPLTAAQSNQGDAVSTSGFTSQADVLVNTRLAADTLGATKMDRPEWGAIDPTTDMVYFALTNNTSRSESEVDGPNPRANNRWGQIVRWSESGNDPAATSFNWDLFIMAGPSDDSSFNGQPLTQDQIFNSPDGLWFDKEGRCWIQTDISEGVMNTGDFAQFGNNQMLAADTNTKELKRFLTGPLGQEITGVITTPDQRTMFVNVQHPGATTTPADFAAGSVNSDWPNRSSALYPRSATLVITKDDGGIIGS